MSRDINPDLLLALQQTHINPILLAEFDFDSGTTGMWTGYGSLTWGDKSFFGGGNLVGVSTIRETQDLQANAITFNLNGVTTENVVVALDEDLQGRACRLYIGHAKTKIALAQEDDEGGILLESGDRILLESENFEEPYQIYSGLMNVIRGKVRIPISELALSAENILIWLKRTKERRYNDEDQQAKYAGDLFFQFIAQLQDKNIVW